ncbi:MAG: phage tail tape measure protein, partial [Nitrosopumilus sp.]
MADKEFSIEMTTGNSERNAGRLLADLQSIQREIKGVTEASASMDIKSKKLTGTLLQQVSAAQKVRIAFKDTKEGLKLIGISATDTSKKLAALAVVQNKLARQEAGSAKLNFLVQKGRELELLKESIRLKIQEGKLEKANVALRGKVDTGAKLTRLKEEQSLINKIHSIERARLRTEKSLITDPAKRTRDLAAATRAEAKSKQQVAIASKKAAIANQRLSAVNEKATKSTTDLNISWTSLVRLLSAQVIYRAVFGMAAQLKQAFDNAVELQVAISELQTIAPPTESFGEFAVVLREVSDKFGLDIIEATEAGYQALSNQIVDTAAEMGRFLEVMGRLSIATRSTLAESVNLATGVLNAYRLGVEDAEEVSAKLFKTIELGRVRAEEMANSLGNVAILANQVGFSLDELLGLITTLTIQGIKFSEAQTQIRGILIKLIKPTRAMTEFLRDLGFESGEAAIKALGLIKFLALMSERTGDSTTEIAKLINRVRGLSGALAVTGKGFFLLQRNIDEISKKSMPAFNRAITLVLDNQGKKFQIFQNQLKNFFTQDIGQEFVSALSSLVFGFDNLLTVMKLLANTVVNVMVPVIVAGLATMTKSFVALIIAMGPFGIAISAILVAGTAFVTLLRSMRFHAERMEDAFNAMNAAAREVSDEIENTLGRALNDLADSFRDVFESISGNIAAAAAKELGALEKAVQSIGDLFEAIGDALEESIDAASDKIEDMVDTFESGLKAITKLIKKISNEFARISLSAKEAAFEITFDAATPAQQAQLLTDKLKDLQAVLGSTIDFDIFVKTQKEIEKTLFRQQNIAQKAIDIEEKRAKKTVKDRDKLIRDLEKLEKRLVKEQAKSRKFKGRVPVSGGRDEQEIGQLIEKINELKEQGRNLEAIISGFKIGGFDIGAGGAEEIRRAAEDAEQKLAADVVKQFESGAISAERLLEVLDNVAKAAQQSSQDNLDFAESQKTRLEDLTKFFDGLDKKALKDIFDAKSVDKFEQDITEIESKLKSLATLQGQLGIDNF